MCFYCGSTHELTLDHKWPSAKGGRTHPGNIVLCCYVCNHRKGAMSAGEFIAWLRKHPKWLAANAHARPLVAPALLAETVPSA